MTKNWLFGGALFALAAGSAATYGALQHAQEPVVPHVDGFQVFRLPVGCSGDDVMALEGQVWMTSSKDLLFRVENEDGSNWQDPATLYLFAGDGPVCGDPPNPWRAIAQVVVGERFQYVILHDAIHHDGEWQLGETKRFWVGKSEGGHRAWRATGTIDFRLDQLG